MILVVFPLLLASQVDDVSKLVDKIQTYYEKTQSFSAAFRQVYTYRVYKRRQESSGKVYILKPGMMRWDYKAPTKKEFVADGKTLWIYQAEENQVTEQSFRADRMSTSLTFLWGQGRLADEFEIRRAKGVAPQAGMVVLELVPRKSEAHFKKLHFFVDAATGRVSRTVVFDPVGNTNDMTFSSIEENRPLKTALFTFKIPRNANVIRNQ